MYKFFQRNQKKLMAIFAAGLMIVFILPNNARTGANRDRVEGYFGKDVLNANETENAHREWQQLQHMSIGKNGMSMGYLLQQMLGPRAMQEIDGHREMYILLIKEAEKMGISVSRDSIETLLVNDFGLDGPGALQTDAAANLRQMLTHLFLVKGAYERAASIVKVSDPQREHALAEEYQTIRLNLVELSANGFAAAVAPTTQEVDKQFRDYALEDSDTINGIQDPQKLKLSANPFGFGYRYPNRVKLQFITISRDAVVQAVKAKNSEYDWDVAERIYYGEHKADFPTPPATKPAPTTAELMLGPSSQPATAPTSQASTQPAIQPFEQVRDQIKELLVKPEADKLQQDIRERIASVMSADFKAFQAKRSATTAPVSSLGVGYDQYEYLHNLADMIQKQFDVRVSAQDLKTGYLSQKDLKALKGIGDAEYRGIPFPTYAMFADKFFSPDSAEARNPMLLAAWKPSAPLTDKDNNIYIFRLTDLEPSHAPATIAEVQNQVEQDVKKRLGFEKAKEAAAKLEDSAKKLGSLQAAANAEGGQGEREKMLTTNAFRADAEAKIDNVDVTGPSKLLFISEAFKLLEVASKSNPHPIRTIGLPEAGKAMVVELDAVTTLFTDETRPFVNMRIDEQLSQMMRTSLQGDWFTYDSVVTRLNYRPAQPPKQTKP
ncbi:MAG TPA: hypothetical protein VIL86_13275, partial [Tepidisphaeraceae bacterium]